VLIIEDNIDAAESMKMMLEHEEHSVAVAGTGQSGIELAEKMLPEVIFCYIGLPGSMNGYDVAKEIRRRKSLVNTQLVALTGYGRPEDVLRAETAGFDLHLVKPLEPGVLEDTVAKMNLRQETARAKKY